MFIYYRPSGTTPPLAVLLMLTGGIAALVVLAALYVLALWYIRFVYINFLLTFLFAFALSKVLEFGVHAGRLRNVGVTVILSLVIAFGAVYASHAGWATLVQHISGSGHALGSEKLSYIKTDFKTSAYLENLKSPSDVWNTMTVVSKIGLWSFFGVDARGWVLWIVWFSEACIIVFVTVAFPLLRTRKPFSELGGEWIKGIETKKIVKYPGKIPELQNELETGQYDRLLKSELAGEKDSGLRITFYEDAPQQLYYLEIDSQKSDDKNKKNDPDAERLQGSISYIIVPAAVYVELLERLRA